MIALLLANAQNIIILVGTMFTIYVSWKNGDYKKSVMSLQQALGVVSAGIKLAPQDSSVQKVYLAVSSLTQQMEKPEVQAQIIKAAEKVGSILKKNGLGTVGDETDPNSLILASKAIEEYNSCKK